jgi:hypothetical protein
MTDPIFPGFARPSTDMQRVRDRRAAGPWYVDVPLDTGRSIAANTGFQLPFVSGNRMYFDQLANGGGATLTLNADGVVKPTKITVQGGFVFKGGFHSITIENDAQPGKVLRVVWGTDIDFAPSVFTIGGTVATQESGYQYGAAYSSNALIAAGGTAQVFAPASNINGAIVHQVYAYSGSAGSQGIALLAKTGAAPASLIDGDGIASAATAVVGGTVQVPQLPGPVRIAPGKGLWFFASLLETGALRHVLYTLL